MNLEYLWAWVNTDARDVPLCVRMYQFMGLKLDSLLHARTTKQFAMDQTENGLGGGCFGILISSLSAPGNCLSTEWTRQLAKPFMTSATFSLFWTLIEEQVRFLTRSTLPMQAHKQCIFIGCSSILKQVQIAVSSMGTRHDLRTLRNPYVCFSERRMSWPWSHKKFQDYLIILCLWRPNNMVLLHSIPATRGKKERESLLWVWL